MPVKSRINFYICIIKTSHFSWSRSYFQAPAKKAGSDRLRLHNTGCHHCAGGHLVPQVLPGGGQAVQREAEVVRVQLHGEDKGGEGAVVVQGVAVEDDLLRPLGSEGNQEIVRQVALTPTVAIRLRCGLSEPPATSGGPEKDPAGKTSKLLNILSKVVVMERCGW